MNYPDVAASSMLRIGMFAAHQALTSPAGELAKNIQTGAALGAYYVLSRSATVLLGKRVVSKLAMRLGPSKQEGLDKSKLIVYGSLWIPAIAMSCSLANLSGVPISFKNAAILTGAGTSYAWGLRIAGEAINKKFNIHLPSMPIAICASLDPLSEDHGESEALLKTPSKAT